MLAPGDQFRTLIARASVPAVMPGLSHDDVPCPPREHGRIRRRQPRSECGSAMPLSIMRGPGPGSPPGPATRDLVLLADPGLVLPPQFYRSAVREARPDRFQGGGESFLKSSNASGFWA